MTSPISILIYLVYATNAYKYTQFKSSKIKVKKDIEHMRHKFTYVFSICINQRCELIKTFDATFATIYNSILKYVCHRLYT